MLFDQVYWSCYIAGCFFDLKGGLVKKLLESKKEQEAVQPKKTEIVSGLFLGLELAVLIPACSFAAF